MVQPHHDPFRTLYERYEKFVIVCNLIVPLYYFWFIGILFIETIDTFERRNFAQLVAGTAVGMHYFTFAWSKIFTDKHPQLIASNYLIYATIFMFITYERCERINARWLTKSPLVRYLRSMDVKLTYSTVAIALPAFSYSLSSIWNVIVRKVGILFNQLYDDAVDVWYKCRRWAMGRRKTNTRRPARDRNDSSHSSTTTTRGGSRGSIDRVRGSARARRKNSFSIFSRNTASEEENESCDASSSSGSDSEVGARRYKAKESDALPLLQRLRSAIFRK